MELVADTNILIAAILRPGLTRKTLFKPELALFSPQQTLEELAEHKPELILKSGLGEAEYTRTAEIILSRTSILPPSHYEHGAEEAMAISPDHEDWPFFAIALQRNCAIWSNEKRLKGQTKVKVYNTVEMLGILGER